jgi:uncharacterized membrane protein
MTNERQDRPLPDNIPDYLEHLRRSLAGADPALVQDALYDAEEYLRSELAANPGMSEADVIRQVASSYGAPDEVADIYRDTEVTVATALRAPPPKPRGSVLGRFFGVFADPRAYAALFYMLLSLATGIFYFTWTVTGISLSAGLSILIIGIPVVILYFGSVRLLSLVEGRIVEVMLGERMPRRPLYASRGKPMMKRIGEMFTDPRTWTTQLYFLLMLPLGVTYFSLAVTLFTFGVMMVLTPLAVMVGLASYVPESGQWLLIDVADSAVYTEWAAWWLLPGMFVLGVLTIFVTMHIARAIGMLHGQLAKHLLVKTAQYT